MDFSLYCKFKLYCDVTPSVLLIEAYFVIIDYNLLCTIHKSRNLNKIYRHNRIKHEFQIKQEAHEPHRSPEKQFHPINTFVLKWLYIIP